MIIFRYLTREVYSTLLAITSVLLLIFISNTFIRYLHYVATGHFSSEAALKILAIQVPILLGYMLPLALFIGILLAYGRLYVDNEMIVLFACGFSKLRLLVITLVGALFITAIVTGLVFWTSPKMIWFQEHIISQTLAESALQKLPAGRFVAVNNDNWVFYARYVSKNHRHMQDLFAWQHNQKDIGDSVITASKAYQHKLGESRYLVLKDGVRYTGQPGSGKYKVEKFGEYWLRIPSKPLKERKPEQYASIAKLWKDKKNSSAAAELQWRIAMPLSVIVLTLLAVPFSRVKARQGKFAQLIPAILVYIVYADLIFVARVWIQKGNISSALGIWWVHGIFFLLSILLLGTFFGWWKKTS